MARSRRTKIVALSILAISLPTLYWAFDRAEAREPRRIGPYTCLSCNTEYPVATENDLQQIKYQNHFLKTSFHDESKGPADYAGDVIIICNLKVCVDWKMTNSGGWEGTNPRRQGKLPGGSSGSGHGGGQGVGRGGGADIGGGSYGGGGRTGSVTVGPTGPLPKLPKGSQEI